MINGNLHISALLCNKNSRFPAAFTSQPEGLSGDVCRRVCATTTTCLTPRENGQDANHDKSAPRTEDDDAQVSHRWIWAPAFFMPFAAQRNAGKLSFKPECYGNLINSATKKKLVANSSCLTISSSRDGGLLSRPGLDSSLTGKHLRSSDRFVDRWAQRGTGTVGLAGHVKHRKVNVKSSHLDASRPRQQVLLRRLSI